MSYFRITLMRSGIGMPAKTQGVLKALGLRKRMTTVYHPVSQSVAGQIMRIKELVDVKEVDRALSKDEQKAARRPAPGYYIESLPDEPITCSLGYSSFQKHDSGHVAYQALSYCWGEASDTTPIRLYCPVAKNASPDRLDTDHTLIQYHVTQNLKAALRSLRLFAKPRTLWIDAVCMNQSDPKEKTHQSGWANKI
ncbi:39S ribosomal protein L33, mitochondrial [Didymella heteroderae]|uniref:Large ribosomal subunit protein uL30m n=1 Tax=Didymella heteroderae TaxID=1769908 RepID=A0A9P4X1I1_9PLEO|nr:39S ribosomal protein L33, mitochondrial [Didymella heteroderae]